MASTVEELTVNYEEDGTLVVKELDKAVLTKGTWATLMFRYQELDRKTGEYGPEKFGIRRYQKRSGEYRQQSKFTISNAEQARKVIAILQGWLPE